MSQESGILICKMADQADAHWLWQESVNRLESLRLRVCEGRDLDCALEFARFFLWCGIDKFLKPFDSQGPLKVDTAFLRWKAEDLQRQVQELYTSGKASEGKQSTLQAIDHKLDIIAAHVAGLTAPAIGDGASSGRSAPDLHVIKGGG